MQKDLVKVVSYSLTISIFTYVSLQRFYHAQLLTCYKFNIVTEDTYCCILFFCPFHIFCINVSQFMKFKSKKAQFLNFEIQLKSRLKYPAHNAQRFISETDCTSRLLNFPLTMRANFKISNSKFNILLNKHKNIYCNIR